VTLQRGQKTHGWGLFACWGGTHTGHSHRKAKGESRLRPSPAKLGWDTLAVLPPARRIRWSICAPHVGQYDVGVTLFLEVPFRQLWCITSLSRKKCPRFDWAPPGMGPPTPAGLGIRCSPGRGPRKREGAKDHLRPNADLQPSPPTKQATACQDQVRAPGWGLPGSPRSRRRRCHHERTSHRLRVSTGWMGCLRPSPS